MTLEEKAGFVSGGDFWHSQAVERLGIPSVLITDGPSGLRKQEEGNDHLGINGSRKSVSYPTGSCIACSFDRDLVYEYGKALGDEAQAEKVGVLLGPAVNIKRTPLCGRNFEYFSEDPYLAGELAAAYINGVQSRHIGTSIKHFAANSQEFRRMTMSSEMDERTLREIYLPAFETAVKKAQPWTVMCSYNKINGTYASENETLLKQILRDEWGFEGFVVSDWGAVSSRVKGLKAGMDLEMPGPAKAHTKELIQAVQNGELEEKDLDRACEKILRVFERYWEHMDPDASYDYEEHHRLAGRMAAESMVLLKNENQILPLKKDAKIAFLGQFAEKPRYQGGGSSHVNSYKETSALEAASGYNILYAPGYKAADEDPDEVLLAEAAEKAVEADVAVIFAGTTDRMESEAFDRADLSIPASHVKLIETVTQLQPNTIVVIHAGSCIEMPWINQVKAVLYAYMGGEAAGSSVVDILYGIVNPSGRLAETFPLRLEDNPSYPWYPGTNDRAEYREGIFTGYRWYDKTRREVLFPFGHGMSYTDFAYSNLMLDKEDMEDKDTLQVTVTVKNIGNLPGKETIQLYVVNPGREAIRPIQELRDFQKVSLLPGEETTVTFCLDKRAFAWYDPTIHNWRTETGEYRIAVGKSSRDIVMEKPVNVRSSMVSRSNFTIDSTLGDIMGTAKGAQVIGQMLGGTAKSVEGAATAGDSPAMSAEAAAAMFRDIPLRGMMLFAGDDFTPEVMQWVLDQVNEA